MGSEDKFQDAQTGVSYQIYKPTYVGDLLIRSFSMQSCGAGKEQWLAAIYGEDRSIQILETNSSVKCSNPGLGVKVATTNINRNKARVVVFCDPSNRTQWKKCKLSDLQNYGGYIMWKALPTKRYKGTEIEVLVSGFTYSELLKIARGLKPAS